MMQLNKEYNKPRQ